MEITGPKHTYSAAALETIAPFNFKASDLIGHLSILTDLRPQMRSVEMLTNIMPMTLNFNHPFRVLTPSHEEKGLGRPNFEKGYLVWYTNGSKIEQGLWIGIFGSNHRPSIVLGQTPSIFQAEILGINICALENIKRHLHMCTDNRATLKALKPNCFESKLVWRCSNNVILP